MRRRGMNVGTSEGRYGRFCSQKEQCFIIRANFQSGRSVLRDGGTKVSGEGCVVPLTPKICRGTLSGLRGHRGYMLQCPHILCLRLQSSDIVPVSFTVDTSCLLTSDNIKKGRRCGTRGSRIVDPLGRNVCLRFTVIDFSLHFSSIDPRHPFQKSCKSPVVLVRAVRSW